MINPMQSGSLAGRFELQNLNARVHDSIAYWSRGLGHLIRKWSGTKKKKKKFIHSIVKILFELDLILSSDTKIWNFFSHEANVSFFFFSLKSMKLRAELSEGRTFEGWHEGIIEFAPTYKYYPNSDKYYGWNQTKKGEKQRAPAW